MTDLFQHLEERKTKTTQERLEKLIKSGEFDYIHGIIHRKKPHSIKGADGDILCFGLHKTNAQLMKLLHDVMFFPSSPKVHFVETVNINDLTQAEVLRTFHYRVERGMNPYDSHNPPVTPYTVFDALLAFVAEQEKVNLKTVEFNIDMLMLGKKFGYQFRAKRSEIDFYGGEPSTEREIYPKASRTYHINDWGGTGSGKSSACEKLCEIFYESGDKIIDLLEEGRGEAYTYCFPQQDPTLLRILKEHKQEPKAYPTEVLTPFIVGPTIKMPIKKDGLARWKLYKIRLSDMSVTDFEVFLDKLSPGALDILHYALLKMKKGGDIADLMETIESQKEDRKIVKSLLRKLRFLGWSKLFVGDDYEPPDSHIIVLDMNNVMREREWITVFNTQYLEDKMRNIIYSYILRKIYDLRQGVEYPQMRLYIRELSTLAPSRRTVNTGRQIIDMAKKGRDRGCGLIVDSQRALDCEKTVRQQMEIKIVHNLKLSDVESLDEIGLKGSPIADKIPKLNDGVACVINKAGYYYPIYMCPPSSHHKEEKEDVMKIYRKHGYTIKKFEEVDDFKVRGKSTDDKIEVSEDKVTSYGRRKMAEDNLVKKIPQTEIANEVGISQQRVSQIVKPFKKVVES